jgi:hypothetical protein
MVGLLALAHERACEADLAAELDRLIAANTLPNLAALLRRFGPPEGSIADVTVILPSPAIYDALMVTDIPDAPDIANALACGTMVAEARR